MQITISKHFLDEIQLTIENTESLYKQALAVTDFNWESDQINDLANATFEQIAKNGGETETLNTDHDVRTVHDKVAGVAAELQDTI